MEPSNTAESSTPVKKTTKKAPVKKQGRVYKGEKEVDHDLYKLLVAEVVKNHSWWSEKPTFIGQEHTHMFHTIDSNGKKQSHSTNTAGHCHQITYEVDENGLAIPESIKVGPPVRKTKKGFVKIVIEKDAEGKPKTYDNHTHEMIYVQSEKIRIRTKNEKAAARMAAYMEQQKDKLKIERIEPAESNTL